MTGHVFLGKCKDEYENHAHHASSGFLFTYAKSLLASSIYGYNTLFHGILSLFGYIHLLGD